MRRDALLKKLRHTLAKPQFGKLSHPGNKNLILLQQLPLAGYMHHRASGVWPFLQVGEHLRLVREAKNPHDPNAIAVYFRNDRLGYVPRQKNNSLAALMDQGEELEARIARLLETDNPWRRLRFEVYMQTPAPTDAATSPLQHGRKRRTHAWLALSTLFHPRGTSHTFPTEGIARKATTLQPTCRH